jgi:hypothetical protein
MPSWKLVGTTGFEPALKQDPDLIELRGQGQPTLRLLRTFGQLLMTMIASFENAELLP